MCKFKPATICIKEFEHWIVFIREKQVTLGDVVISSKREPPSVLNMLPEEGAGYSKVSKQYADVCTKKFGTVKFNYIIMLKEYFVHYHAFSRYNNDIKLFDIEWKHIDQPGAINFNGGVVLSEEKLE